MQNFVSFTGLFVLIFLAWTISEDRKRFPWRVVTWGLLLQVVFGFLVLWWEPGNRFFLKLNDVFNALLGFSQQGAVFVFNALSIPPGQPGSMGFFFAFQVLTTIIFFSALLSVLYYLGVMQKIVLLFAKIMAHTMKVSGAESLSNSANIFVGQTEAPLVVRPYIEKMTRSEIMAIMVGGFANTAGGVLGAYIAMLKGYFPNIASHLISASLLSAPAAFIFAKILVPEKETPLTMGEVKMDVEIEDANVIDAAANGTTVGWQLAINVAAMLVSFVALLAMMNLGVSWYGDFFRTWHGFAFINAMASAAILSFIAIEKFGSPRDVLTWSTLAVLAVVCMAAKFLAPQHVRYFFLVGLSAWLPMFFQTDRPKTIGLRGWGSVLGIIAVSNLAYIGIGPLESSSTLTIELILGWIHWPIAFIMGVPAADCLTIGKYLGEKLILTEFTAYFHLAGHLGEIAKGNAAALDPRSIVILTYALCGFANFASIAIQIGGIAPLAPSRRHDIARLGFKAMVGGALATYMIACIAGMFYTGHSMLGDVQAVAQEAADAETTPPVPPDTETALSPADTASVP